MKQLKAFDLRTLLLQYEEDPDADYTIYLGKRDKEDYGGQKKQKREKGLDGNEEMFDCWLEKQASCKSIQENHSFQQKIKSKREQYGNI